MVACPAVHGLTLSLRVTLLAFALACTWHGEIARAEGGTLVLIDPDPELRRAAEVALAPWGLDVQVLAETAPGATLPRSAARARTLAKAHQASALAWISHSEEGYALWVYEQQEDRVVAQPVADGPPYAQAEAAALALSLKALLRHSQAAPEPERFGATPAPPPRRDGVVLGLAGGMRAFEIEGGSAEARVWLSTAYLWPAWGGAVGPVLEANLGFGGVTHETAQARTQLRAHAIALAGQGRWPLGDRFDLGTTLGLTVRLTRLTGELLAPAAPVDVRRANPTTLVRLSTGLHVGRVRLSLRAGCDVPLRTQRYLVDGRDVLSLAPAALEVGLGVEVFMQ